MITNSKYDITHLNTFRLNSIAKSFAILSEIAQLSYLADIINQEQIPFLILGGGSNLILPEFFNGLVIYNQLKGVEVVGTNLNSILVEVGAGEVWDDFVAMAVTNDWFGLENLSLIPGTVGASPIQNIGAYGVEVKDFIEYVKVYDLSTKQFKTLTNSECAFSYRNSIFKTMPSLVVTAVGFKLHIIPKINISYTDVQKCLNGNSNITPMDVRNCIIGIRQTKLPDPKQIGNVGSFFHNPVINKIKAHDLRNNHLNLPVYEVDDNHVKISAGFLIDNLGLKGFSLGNLAVYNKQALVLVNLGDATQTELLNFAKIIQDKVYQAYTINLNIEPIIIHTNGQN